MAEILTGNWHLDPAIPPSRPSLQKGRGQEAYCDTDSWSTGERAFCFILRPKLSAFRSTKLLYFGSKVVTIRVNVEFCCVTSLLIILKVLQFWVQLIFYSWRPNPRAYAQVGGVGDLHGWCIYLRSLTHVTLHVIGSNPLINKHNPITIGHVSYSWQNVVVTTTRKENKTNENVLES